MRKTHKGRGPNELEKALDILLKQPAPNTAPRVVIQQFDNRDPVEHMPAPSRGPSYIHFSEGPPCAPVLVTPSSSNRIEHVTCPTCLTIAMLRRIVSVRNEPTHFMEAALDDAQKLLDQWDKAHGGTS